MIAVDADSMLAAVETWQTGDEFHHDGEWLEVLYFKPGPTGSLYVFVDGDEPGDPVRQFTAEIGAPRRIRRAHREPTRPTISHKEETE